MTEYQVIICKLHLIGSYPGSALLSLRIQIKAFPPLVWYNIKAYWSCLKDKQNKHFQKLLLIGKSTSKQLRDRS